jgi:hypothetical protein
VVHANRIKVALYVDMNTIDLLHTTWEGLHAAVVGVLQVNPFNAGRRAKLLKSLRWPPLLPTVSQSITDTSFTNVMKWIDSRNQVEMT